MTAPPRRRRRLAAGAAALALVAFPLRATWWRGLVPVIAETGIVGGLAGGLLYTVWLLVGPLA